MRRLLFLLRDADDGPSNHPSPFLARLDALVAHLPDTGLPVDLSVTGSIEQIPSGVDWSAYPNRPGGPDQLFEARWAVRSGPGEIVCGAAGPNVAISDDGRAGDSTSGRGHGLIGIRERVAVVGSITAVRVVADGGSMFAPSMARHLIGEFARRAPSTPRPTLSGLTEREVEVLEQIARGRSNAEISARLCISENTVKTHVARTLMKLDLRDRVQAVVVAYGSGWVKPVFES